MTAAVLVVNPVAGAGRALDKAAVLERELHRVGIRTSLFTTALSDDDSLTSAVASADVAIAVGGDGTLNRVVSAAVSSKCDRRPRIAFLAAGTGNAAVRAFSLPRKPVRVAQLIAEGATRTVDVGVVTRDGAQAAVFLLWAGAGVDAELIERVAQTRAAYRGVRLAGQYVMQALRLLLTFEFPLITLPSRGNAGPFGGVMVANVGHLAAGSVTIHADPGDGLLNVIATTPRSRLSWVAAAMLSGAGLYDRCPGVSRMTVADIQIDSASRVPVHADGEPIGTLPVEISVMPAAIKLCAPDLRRG